jgi:predicted ATPase with chaperone activity
VLRLHRAGGRARIRLLRVARTLADLDDRDELRAEDVLEAAALRGFARQTALLPP